MKIHSPPPDIERSAKPQRKTSKFKQILIQVRGKITPLFQDPKRCMKKSDFQWTPKAERAFQGMKQCIAELPMVIAPRPKEELIMNLCAAREALEAFDITYRPRTSICGQVLADFIAERPDEKGPQIEAPAEEVNPEP
ncbi:hypothetical protein Tco_1240263 [Tanacetum coccineum]